MASFTDQIPEFNPYIQQLPIDAMVEVGTQKQQLYDQGIERIQNQIDQVAGLDVIRDIDKQYLQSKLNSLGNQLRTVAAGDFSNFQLVNSVLGMTNKIAQDPNVVNALVSTQKYRKGIEEMEKAIQEGKSSPSNEWFFQRAANEWLSGKDVRQKFNGSYQPYVNYKKNALEIIKSLTGDETITEDIFSTDKDGKLVIAEAIIKKRFKGITPEKIQTALNSSLTPADFKQMEIDGMYQYSNVSDEDFVARINDQYSKDYGYMKSKKEMMEIAREMTDDPTALANIEKDIENAQLTMNRLKSDYDNISASFSTGNTDAAKAALYAKNFMDQFSRAFSYSEYEIEHKDSPYAKMAMEKEKMRIQMEQFNANFNQRERFHQDNLKMEMLKLNESDKDPFAKPVPSGIDESDVDTANYENLTATVTTKQKAVDATKNKIVQRFIYNYKQDNGIEPSVEEILNFEGNVRSLWERNQLKDPILQEEMNKLYSQERDLLTYENLLNNIDDVYNQTFNEYLGSLDPEKSRFSEEIEFQDGTSETLSFTAKDVPAVVDLANEYVAGGSLLSIFDTFDPTIGGEELGLSFRTRLDLEKAMEDVENGVISPHEYNLLYALSTSTKFRDYVNSLRGEYGKKLSELMTQRDEDIAASINLPGKMSEGVEVTPGLVSLLNEKLSQANALGGGLPNSPNFDSESLAAILAEGEKNISVRLNTRVGNSLGPSAYEAIIGAGGIETRIAISEDEYQRSWRQAVTDLSSVNSAMGLIQAMYINSNIDPRVREAGGEVPFLSTARNGKAYFNTPDFANVVNFGVRGNFESTNGGATGILKVQFYNPVEGKWSKHYSFPENVGTVKVEAVEDLLRDLDDSWIFSKLYKKEPTPEDFEKIESLRNNPYGK